MKRTRRNFLLTAVGLFAAGCATSETLRRPPVWPGQTTIAPPPPKPVPSPTPRVYQVATVSPAPGAVGSSLIHAIPRSSWASASPNMSHVTAMDRVDRITIHHEGWTPVTFTDAPSTAERLDLMRKSHIQRLGAGDIGYHYIIDRAGRLWQGREAFYQGAHVRSNNEKNIGVMVLGNFETQTPTDAQLTTLGDTLTKLIRQYRVSAKRVYTHRELNPTECPGANLQPRTVTLRAEASRAARSA